MKHLFMLALLTSVLAGTALSVLNVYLVKQDLVQLLAPFNLSTAAGVTAAIAKEILRPMRKLSSATNRVKAEMLIRLTVLLAAIVNNPTDRKIGI